MDYTPDTTEINARLILRGEKAKEKAQVLLAFKRAVKILEMIERARHL